MHTCEICGSDAPTQHVTFHQNVGLVILRFGSRVTGDLCRPCIDAAFWRTSLISFFFGWWGVISFFITLFTLPMNLATYLGTLSLPRGHDDALSGSGASSATLGVGSGDAGRAYPAAYRDRAQGAAPRAGMHPVAIVLAVVAACFAFCGCGVFGLFSWLASLPPPSPRADRVEVTEPTAPALVLGGDLDVGATMPSAPIVRYGEQRGERVVDSDGEECAGDIPFAAPHVLIVGAELALRVSATAAGGASLVIERPDGTFVCAFDPASGSATIDETFAPGSYRVYVGQFGASHPYAVAVSAQGALRAEELRPPHRVSISSVTFPETKPDGRPWDVMDGPPDILIQVRQDGALVAERFLGQDTYQSYETFTLPSPLLVSREHPLEIRAMDRDPAVSDDAGSVMIDDLEQHATRYAYVETSSGVEIQVEVDLAD